jgi:maltose alpha-D-glucosyltransferase/alpha-amylase
MTLESRPPPRLKARAKKRVNKAAEKFIDDPLWYKDAVIYQVHVKSYFDGNNDGVGDFPGLIEKLDYIAGLGVNTIWLLPFYPSPRRDDGYDIAHYEGVHEDYGTMADAKRFIKEAHARGLRVITELVINHTSDQHPWFQRARHAKPGSKWRDFYVWSDDDQKYSGTRIIFLDTEKSNWTWDPVANAYFWHRFYSHQPDLNFDNPQVLEAVLSVMRFWLDLGVDGLRLDAVPYLIERDGTSNENLPETHALLKKFRAEIDQHYPDRMLLAEANMWPEDVQQYFGDVNEKGEADECHMAFHFPLMPRMYMALAQEDRFPITDILRQTPDIPSNCQWAIFLRNHDELTLEMVTDKERDYLWNYYASDKRARINLGIRRRLAPLLERDRRRVELLNSLLLSMPGTPVLYYGDEIGMGDNIHLGDRDGVRTPMQWSIDRNGGFSRADTSSLVLPPIQDPLYGYLSVNVETQTRDPHSLLNWTRRMLAVRKQQKAFGRGTLRVLYPSNRRILAYLREFTNDKGETETILCVANVSRAAQAVELDLTVFAGRVPVEMLGGTAFPPIGQLPYLLTVQPYGFYWFVLAASAQMPAWHSPPPQQMPEFATFVLRHGVDDLLRVPARTLLEREVLPTYLSKRRWFASKDEKILEVRVANATSLSSAQAQRPMLLTEIEVRNAKGTERYLLPLGFVPESEATLSSALPQQLALARVRRGPQIGYLTDAFTLEAFARCLIHHLRNADVLPAGGTEGELRFVPTSRLQEIESLAEAEVRWLAAEQSNSSLVIGDVAIIKIIRRVSAGIHPEAEMGRYLTERGYANAAAMLGELTRVEPDGTLHVLAVVQAFKHNQGDAWVWTLNTLERAIRDATTAGAAEIDNEHDAFTELETFARLLGKRLGELHVALAQPTDNAAFAPERASAKDANRWADAVIEKLGEALDVLGALKEWPQPADKQRADYLRKHREALTRAVKTLAQRGIGSLRTRIHGDFHLGQVLAAQGDVFIIDFEGEPARPLAERRAKTSPYKDVAGQLRSFDYAAAMALSSAANAASGSADSTAEQRIDITTRFREISETAFLFAYREAAAGVAHDWKDPAGESALIDLFSLEKAAYEVRYEAANRPAWIGVPLRGLAAIAEHLLAGKDARNEV